MLNILEAFRREWGAVKQAKFACALCLLGGVAATALFFNERISVLNQQVALWKDKVTANPPPISKSLSDPQPPSKPPSSVPATTSKTTAEIHTTSGSPSGPVNVQTGGVASFGQQGGVTAGKVVLTGDEALIRSIEFHLDFDVPTETRKAGQFARSLGIQNTMAFFDKEHVRYRFVNADYQYVDWQKLETVHRYGFVYTPEDQSQFAGRTIDFLTTMSVWGFNFSSFVKAIGDTALDQNGHATIMASLFLNGIKVADWQDDVTTSQLLAGQLTESLGTRLSSVESAYKAEREKRSH